MPNRQRENNAGYPERRRRRQEAADAADAAQAQAHTRLRRILNANRRQTGHIVMRIFFRGHRSVTIPLRRGSDTIRLTKDHPGTQMAVEDQDEWLHFTFIVNAELRDGEGNVLAGLPVEVTRRERMDDGGDDDDDTDYYEVVQSSDDSDGSEDDDGRSSAEPERLVSRRAMERDIVSSETASNTSSDTDSDQENFEEGLYGEQQTATLRSEGRMRLRDQLVDRIIELQAQVAAATRERERRLQAERPRTPRPAHNGQEGHPLPQLNGDTTHHEPTSSTSALDPEIRRALRALNDDYTRPVENNNTEASEASAFLSREDFPTLDPGLFYVLANLIHIYRLYPGDTDEGLLHCVTEASMTVLELARVHAGEIFDFLRGLNRERNDRNETPEVIGYSVMTQRER